MFTIIRNIAGYITIQSFTVATVAINPTTVTNTPVPVVRSAAGTATVNNITPIAVTAIPAIKIPAAPSTKPAKNAYAAITSEITRQISAIPIGITTGIPIKMIRMINKILSPRLVAGFFCSCGSGFL